METRRYLQGGLIIDVVWLLAESSWLHFLTLISGKPARLHFAKHVKWAGSLLSRTSTGFIILVL